MSYITQATAGLESVQASKWDDAVRQLSAGIKESPNPAWLIARSRALIGLKRFEEALDDANQAWHVAYERNKRPLLVEAQYRRAVAYFRLGQYANADACCIYSMRLVKGSPAIEKVDPTRENVDAEGFYKATYEDAKKESRDDPINSSENAMGAQSGRAAIPQAQDWRRASAMRIQALNAMEKLPQDDPARKLTAVLKPPFKDVSQKHVTEEKKKAPAVSENKTQQPAIVRLQDFQTDTMMTVTLFSKGNDKDATKVEFRDSSVHINSIKYQNGEMKPYSLRLWGEIDVDASKYTITPSKVELSLKKKKAGKWNQLQSEAQDGEEVQDEQAAAKEQEEKETLETLKEARKKAMEEATEKETEEVDKSKTVEEKGKEPAKPAGPAYPTSSRSGPKNWDNIGDDDSDDEKDVNYFFKKLYKNAGPEQQRAMMKSFTESNGTSLSTDWSDVKDRKVETVPPDGVEAKKWD